MELEVEGVHRRGRLEAMRVAQPIGSEAKRFQPDAREDAMTRRKRIGLVETHWVRSGWRAVLALGFGFMLIGSHYRVEAGMEEALKAAAEREAGGDFSGAEAVLAKAEAEAVAGGQARSRGRLEFERERLRRIRRDFPLRRRDVVEGLSKSVRDFREEELVAWLKEGLLDRQMIDGEERFFVSSVSNLFFRRPELEARRVPARDTSALQRAHLENARSVRAAARERGMPHVLPKRFQVRMTVRVLPGSVEAGARVQAWLPVPRSFPHQGEFALLSSDPMEPRVAPAESPIRSVYMERPATSDGSVTFEIAYAYTAHAVSFDLSSPRSGVVEASRVAPEWRRYMEPGPHVEFTESMRRLAETVAAGETEPVARARRYYEWIAGWIRYSYAPEYSTIRNLGEACRSSGRGDCGQAAFLLMTLCRISGIPARWQSGWAIFPGDETIHDWCEVHLEPWGWVPVDPYMGMYAMQYATQLSPEERVELRDFYFGGLTQYRMAANSDHGQELWPPKRAMRSDEVDFQRGEIESDGRNLFFDRFRYELKWEEVSKP